MKDLLEKLGWKEKEVQCYLSLLEFGQQPASVISKRLEIPKATVLFVLHRLCDRGYIKMKKRDKTEYFYADPKDFEQAKNAELREQNQLIEQVIPLLNEYKNPLTSPPKISFFEGTQSCKQAYARLLESRTEILEFATHEDLVEKFGKEWMDDFILQRTKKNISIQSICHETPFDRHLQSLDKKQKRDTKFVSGKDGMMYSCIDIYEDKVLLLNLGSDSFGILIENSAIVETMKTIHRLAWASRLLHSSI